MKIIKYEETESKDVKLWFTETDYIQVEDVRGNLLEVLEEQFKKPKTKSLAEIVGKRLAQLNIKDLRA